jgi:hypothetical protein
MAKDRRLMVHGSEITLQFSLLMGDKRHPRGPWIEGIGSRLTQDSV